MLSLTLEDEKKSTMGHTALLINLADIFRPWHVIVQITLSVISYDLDDL